MSHTLFCISGPSGSGKTSIMRDIMPSELLSFTTRPMRDGETNGLDYLFISFEEFNELLDEGLLAEETEYDGQYYGLTTEEIATKLENSHAFFICDNNGLIQLKAQYSNIVSIFIYASVTDCAVNMLSRGDTCERVDGRLATYDNEIANRGQYDYVVKNIRGFRQQTVDIVSTIVKAEDCRYMMEGSELQ